MNIIIYNNIFIIIIIRKLRILCKTWKKEADDLFDFEASDVIKSEFIINDFNKISKFFLVYFNDKINLINSFDSLLEKYKEIQNKTKDINPNNRENNFLILTEFNKISSLGFKICNPILSDSLKKKINELSCLCRVWRFSKKNEENLINVGDILKLGRVRLKIETICFKGIYETIHISNNFIKNKIKFKNRYSLNLNKNISNNMNTNINYSQNESILLEDEKLEKNKIKKKLKEKIKLISNIENSSISSQKNSSSRPTCRICYLLNSDIENPLISPCNCNGSMKYIHYKCLKNCIEANLIKKKEDNYKYYFWKNYSCEICQKEYPKYLKIKETLYPLIDLEINYLSYITCDYSLYDDTKRKTIRKGILVIKINDDNNEDIISLGRSQNNRVSLKDISVSRTHCNIIKRKNKLYIIDKGSKFGSLIYINNPLNINLKNNEEIIISGRHWFSIKFEENKSFFSKFFPINCCQCNEIKNLTNIDVDNLEENIYDNQIEKIKDNNNLKNNMNFQILDTSYQDYILDLGEDIYLHEQSESEEL